ncbi:hypothetical protein [Rickettsia bellii]|uniref:Uncharacterized protein n=1 Tax=Rickettsia bellii (strain RML369-C) TaxID=336407 RepID=Q1RGX9_RICBR|nr:hypothetical protein [Rickettsia bellii]ABE05385.1 unknown [Rickettsia bellii RML369-C]
MTTKEEDFDEITLEEDMYFSKLADKRLEETKHWIKHEDFWGTPPFIAKVEKHSRCDLVDKPALLDGSYVIPAKAGIQQKKSLNTENF